MSNKERRKFAVKIQEALIVSTHSVDNPEVIIDMYLLAFEQEVKTRILLKIDELKGVDFNISELINQA